jgi:hypothetical protein
MQRAALTLMALSSLAALSACAPPYDPGAMAYNAAPVYTTDPTYAATAASYVAEQAYYDGGPIYLYYGGPYYGGGPIFLTGRKFHHHGGQGGHGHGHGHR